MADVLLTHSNHLYNDRKQVRKMQPYPPLQTLLAAACLRREGYQVALFDPTLEAPEPASSRRWRAIGRAWWPCAKTISTS